MCSPPACRRARPARWCLGTSVTPRARWPRRPTPIARFGCWRTPGLSPGVVYLAKIDPFTGGGKSRRMSRPRARGARTIAATGVPAEATADQHDECCGGVAGRAWESRGLIAAIRLPDSRRWRSRASWAYPTVVLMVFISFVAAAPLIAYASRATRGYWGLPEPANCRAVRRFHHC